MNKIVAIVFTTIAFISSSVVAQKTDSLPSRVYIWNSLKAINEGTGIRRIIMKGSTTSLNDFEVYAATIEPGKTQQAPTYKDREVLIIVKDGQLRITLNGVSKIFEPGSVVFVMPTDSCGIENGGRLSATYYEFTYRSKLPSNLERAKQNGGSFTINWNDLEVGKTDKGHRRAFFNRPTSQLEKFEMHTTALNAGFNSHAPHTHKEEEIILLLKGNVEMFIAGQLYQAKAGDMVFLASGISHALTNTGKEQCEYFAFQWRN